VAQGAAALVLIILLCKECAERAAMEQTNNIACVGRYTGCNGDVVLIF